MMTKASSVFDVFSWVNWITQDKEGCVCAWEKEPKITDMFWVLFSGNRQIIGYFNIDDFKGKDWTECCIERPKEVKTFEQLRDWAKKNKAYKTLGKNCFTITNNILNVCCVKNLTSGLIELRDSYTNLKIYHGTPAQVKRVLEEMLEQ